MQPSPQSQGLRVCSYFKAEIAFANPEVRLNDANAAYILYFAYAGLVTNGALKQDYSGGYSDLEALVIQERDHYIIPYGNLSPIFSAQEEGKENGIDLMLLVEKRPNSYNGRFPLLIIRTRGWHKVNSGSTFRHLVEARYGTLTITQIPNLQFQYLRDSGFIAGASIKQDQIALCDQREQLIGKSYQWTRFRNYVAHVPIWNEDENENEGSAPLDEELSQGTQGQKERIEKHRGNYLDDFMLQDEQGRPLFMSLRKQSVMPNHLVASLRLARNIDIDMNEDRVDRLETSQKVRRSFPDDDMTNTNPSRLTTPIKRDSIKTRPRVKSPTVEVGQERDMYIIDDSPIYKQSQNMERKELIQVTKDKEASTPRKTNPLYEGNPFEKMLTRDQYQNILAAKKAARAVSSNQPSSVPITPKCVEDLMKTLSKEPLPTGPNVSSIIPPQDTKRNNKTHSNIDSNDIPCPTDSNDSLLRLKASSNVPSKEKHGKDGSKRNERNEHMDVLDLLDNSYDPIEEVNTDLTLIKGHASPSRNGVETEKEDTLIRTEKPMEPKPEKGTILSEGRPKHATNTSVLDISDSRNLMSWLQLKSRRRNTLLEKEGGVDKDGKVGNVTLLEEEGNANIDKAGKYTSLEKENDNLAEKGNTSIRKSFIAHKRSGVEIADDNIRKQFKNNHSEHLALDPFDTEAVGRVREYKSKVKEMNQLDEVRMFDAKNDIFTQFSK